MLAGGAVEEGAEMVDGRALQFLGREPARLAVAGADPDDVDRAELVSSCCRRPSPSGPSRGSSCR